MATSDKEMLWSAMAKLMEQRDIVVPDPGPLFTELMEFHSTVDDRVSIPRWEREQFPVSLRHLESIPVITGRSFNYYVIDDQMPLLGDQTCINNAKSVHIRCTVNPCGPCEGCKDYQPIQL